MINLHYDVDSPLGPPFGGKARYKYNKQTNKMAEAAVGRERQESLLPQVP